MWFHASLKFDYPLFQREAKELVGDIDKGNLNLLRSKAKEVINDDKYKTFFSKYGYGITGNDLPSVSEVQDSPLSNAIIGLWIAIVMAKYLEPAEVNIGYNWRHLQDYLPRFGWSRPDFMDFINGFPIGLLFGKKNLPKERIEHEDPYWFWIRPRFSYNQGGWLSVDQCNYFGSLLRRTYKDVIKADFSQYPDIPSDQTNSVKAAVLQGISDSITLLESCSLASVGCYSAIYWEWDDE